MRFASVGVAMAICLLSSGGEVVAQNSTGSPYIDAYMKRYSNDPTFRRAPSRGGQKPRRVVGVRNYIFDPYPYYSYRYPYHGYTYPYYLDIEGSRLGPYIAPPVYLNSPRYYPHYPVVPQVAPPQITNNTIIVTPPANERPAPAVRRSNAASKALAAKNNANGDGLFAKQSYNSAFSRYKSAAQAAPDVPDSYFRQGHALVALGRYDQAAQAFRRALSLDSNVPLPEFTLDDLYGDGNLAKIGHRERLAEAAADEPQNGELLFVLGVNLYFDGQRDRANVFFQRAYDLMAPDERKPLTVFLGEQASPDGVDI